MNAPIVVRRLAVASLLLVVGLLTLAIPTVAMIARESWTDEQSQQGPLVLIIGGWLLWSRWPAMQATGTTGSLWLSSVGLAACSVIYVLARIACLYLAEAYALYGFGLATLYALVGWSGLKKGAFPSFFLGFAAPVPFAIGWPVTTALRLWISELVVVLLRIGGITASRDGLTIYASSYRIEIAQACSGMNSLLALSALGLCYVYLRRQPPLRYFIIMLPLVAVFSAVANLFRVLGVVILTLQFGDGVAQGVLHELLGFGTFTVALALTFLADEMLWRPSSLLRRSTGDQVV